MLRKRSFSDSMGFRAGSYSLCSEPANSFPCHEEWHPALYVEFQRGHFMRQKSRRAFANIPRDQMHEQLIDWLKNPAGVRKLDDPSTVGCEQVVCPELARLVREFEGRRVRLMYAP